MVVINTGHGPSFELDNIDIQSETAPSSSTYTPIGLFPSISGPQSSVHSDTPLVPHMDIIGDSNNVVSVIDDAASSICIDEADADYQHALTILRHEGTPYNKSGRLRNSDNSGPSSDFDLYTQRVARQVVLRERLERRRLRIQQKRKPKNNSKLYGNYFSSTNLETKYTLSHVYDNFNGRRQNVDLNHQLNQLNSPFTYGNQQNHENLDSIQEEADDVSFMTMDVDALESDIDDEESAWDIMSVSGSEQGLQKSKLQRRLHSRHINMMALGSTLGVGVLLNAGESFFTCGPLGTLLGYIISGIIVMCTMAGFGEMAALVPSDGGVTAFVSRFVDDSLGFAVGVCYWLTCAMALPSEVTAGSLMITFYPELDYPAKSVTVWITFFLLLILLLNFFEVGVFGEIQYCVSFASIVLFIIFIIYMFVLNQQHVGPNHGKIGFTYWTYSKSNFGENVIYGPFRPVFPTNAKSNGTTISIIGISGSLGVFLQFWIGITKAVYSYIGTEIVFVAAGEVRNPRRSIPAATKKVFWRIAIFYVLAIFAVSLNIYAGDFRLVGVVGGELGENMYNNGLSSASLTPSTNDCIVGQVSWGGVNIQESSPSPWIVALQAAGECTLSSAINGILVFFALSSGVSHLYASSRTLYSLAAEGKIWSVFSACSSSGVPYVAIAGSFAFSLLAYISADHSTAEVFQWLVSLTRSAGVLVYAGISLSFIRFYNSLNLRPDILSRNDEMYPFRSWFQPYTAYFALFMNILLALTSGMTVFVRDLWNWKEFVASYICLVIFAVCYIGHKLITKSKVVPLRLVDLDTGRKEMERIGWEEDRVYTRGPAAKLSKLLSKVERWIGLAHDQFTALQTILKNRLN